MQPRGTGRRVRGDTVPRWWSSLDERRLPPGRPTILLPLTLMLSALGVVGAMPLAWHHLVVPKYVYYGVPTVQVVTGLDTSNWLLAVAAVSVVLAVLTLRTRPANPATWVITVAAFALVNGMIVNYLDWSTRGASFDVKPYFGPGFYVGLLAAVASVVAAVLAWRERDAP